MSNKRFWWSVFAVWLVISVTSFVTHQVWLKDLYMNTSQFWRSEAEIQSWGWLMFVGNFIWSWTFVWIYSKGLTKSNLWQQAFRYAFAIIALSQLPQWTMTWAVSPYPAELVVKWAIAGAFQAMLCACVMTWTFNPKAAWAKR